MDARVKPGHDTACATRSRHAALESLADFLFRQIPPDEDGAAFAFLAFFPGALVVAVEDHMHALEHEALGIVLERQDALAAQDAGPVGGNQILHPGEKLVRVKRLVGPERDRLHVFIVIVLEPAVMVVIVAVVMIVMMIMIMIVLFGLEKRRLDVEDAVEIEGVAAEHLGDVDLGALGAVQPRVRIDAADARLDLGEFAG